jgi:hypothetical protein
MAAAFFCTRASRVPPPMVPSALSALMIILVPAVLGAEPSRVMMVAMTKGFFASSSLRAAITMGSVMEQPLSCHQ